MTGVEAIEYGNELRNKFSLHYDNIMSGASPGLNDYEISLLLTQAQRESLFNYYDGNTKGESFDSNEKIRSLYSYYVHNKSIPAANFMQVTDPPTTTLSYSDVMIGDEVWWILKEHLRYVNKSTVVKPIPQDEFWVISENPLKWPDKWLSRAWRLDLSLNHSDGSLTRGARLVYFLGSTPLSYSFSYVKRPDPIIISDLSDSGDNLTIEGITVTSNNQISIPDPLIKDPSLRDYIINRAVELATRDYKENTLETQMALNSRVD